MVATFVMLGEQDRAFALRYIAKLPLDGKNEVVIRRTSGTPAQMRLLHVSLGAIAKQLAWPPAPPEWVPSQQAGTLHELEWWKRRLTLAWLQETKAEVEVIVGLHGEDFGFLLPHTSDLSTEQLAALNEYVFMFGATNGVAFKEPDKRPVPPPEAYE